MSYYHNLVTQKSWEELQRLNKIADFVLIDGWATYLYTKTLKSKDVDIITEFDQLSKLEKKYRLVKNDRLKKYEATKDEVQIDIYLPHYSQIGIPVEDLQKQTANLEGFTVLEAEYLLALKIYTLTQRGRTPKGRKDFIDIVSLVNSSAINWKKFQEIAQQYKLTEAVENFIVHFKEYYEVPELNLNKHNFAQLKKKLLSQFTLYIINA